MKVLVTGGFGFIGSRVSHLLGDSAFIVDNLSSCTGRSNVNFKANNFTHIDLRKITFPKCDVIVHTAAKAYVENNYLEGKQIRNYNLELTKKVVSEALKMDKQPKIIFTSSAAVLGNSQYGLGKLDEEALIRASGLDCAILRLQNVFGIGKPSTGPSADVLTQFLNSDTIFINGSGSQTRDFVFVDDVAKAIILSIESKTNSNPIEIGTGIQTSINELAAMVLEKFPSKGVERRPGSSVGVETPVSLGLSAKEELGWIPTQSLRSFIRNS